MKKIYSLMAIAMMAMSTVQAQRIVTAADLGVEEAMKAPQKAGEVILTQPRGELFKDYAEAGEFAYNFQGTVYTFPNTYKVYTYVKGSDGNVYIQDPNSVISLGSWIVLTPGQDGTLEAKLPQYLAKSSSVSITLEKLYLTADGKYARKNGSQTAVEEVIKFMWDNDTLKMVNEDGMDETKGMYKSIMGVMKGKTWYGTGDATMKIFKLEATPTTLPEGLEPEYVDISYKDYDYADQKALGKVAYTAEGDKMYLTNPMSTNQWIMGVRDGEGYKVETQYIGVDKKNRSHIWVTPGTHKIVEGKRKYYYTDNVMLNYNAEAKTLTGVSPMSFLLTEGAMGSTWERVTDLSTTVHVEVAATPSAPKDLNFPREYSTVLGLNVQFTQTATDDKGGELNPEKLYYCIYVDGDESTAYTFTADKYRNFTEDVVQVPYLLDDKDWYNFRVYSGGVRSIWLQYDAKKVGVQAVYTGGNEVRKSAIVWGTTKASVNDVDVNRVAVSREYYDLQGRRVMAPQGGIYVVRTRYSDGTVNTAKVVK